MLTAEQFEYLDDALRRRPTIKPQEAPYVFGDGHQPEHLKCQVTAMHLEITKSWRAQIGIQWLNKEGRLLPWTHVINWVDIDLVDFSHPIHEAKLGFTLIGNDVDMANGITQSTGFGNGTTPEACWKDPLLQELHVRWFEKLRRFKDSSQFRFDPAL